MKNALAMAVLVAVALLACKDSKPAGSCDRRDVEGWESCFDYPESELSTGTESCSDNSGKWATTPCNRAGSMGGCKMSSGITKWFFTGTKHTAVETAKLECSGAWVEP